MSGFIAEAPTCAHALARAFSTYKEEPHMGVMKGGEMLWRTYEEVGEEAVNLASGLATLGLERRAAVSVMRVRDRSAAHPRHDTTRHNNTGGNLLRQPA